jgi:hypothetical protein
MLLSADGLHRFVALVIVCALSYLVLVTFKNL